MNDTKFVPVNLLLTKKQVTKKKTSAFKLEQIFLPYKFYTTTNTIYFSFYNQEKLRILQVHPKNSH